MHAKLAMTYDLFGRGDMANSNLIYMPHICLIQEGINVGLLMVVRSPPSLIVSTIRGVSWDLNNYLHH